MVPTTTGPSHAATTDTPARRDWVQPAWSAGAHDVSTVRSGAPGAVTREWAYGDGTGAGVRVCIVDSGIDASHPLVGAVERAITIEAGVGGRPTVASDTEGDVVGHGTGCAGIVRTMAPRASVTSVRVLGPRCTGTISALMAGLSWAVEEHFDVINLSLSSRKAEWRDELHQLTDRASFNGSAVVASANNWAATSWPWAFSSVISVGSHAPTDDGERLQANPTPPARFFAPGIKVRVAWPGGGTRQVTGNSFATPHVAGHVARILGAHPGMGLPELIHVLTCIADNATTRPPATPSRLEPLS
jgi:subtilisin